MGGVRSRKVERAYQEYARTKPDKSGCDFCHIGKDAVQFVTGHEHFKVIRNLFPYARWDNQEVKEHLLIVPNDHIVSLKHLDVAACNEYVELVSNYEFKGFSVYARAPGSVSRSIPHQHTHLLLLAPKPFGKSLQLGVAKLAKMFS